MPRKSKVYLIGFMGSGKTTTGMKLASRLGWSFTDLDNVIEKKSGMTIREIFAVHGERHFREIETETLRELSSADRSVISTGGGTPCHDDNMDLMIGTGLTVYLKLTPSQLKSRLAGSKNTRPLIRNLDDDALLTFIEEKLADREKWYSKAEIVIDGFDTDINRLYSFILPKITPDFY